MIRYFNKGKLIEANKEAIALERNRTLVPEKLEALPDLKFLVVWAFPHNDVEMRCKITLDEEGAGAFLDVPLATYCNLPIVTVNEDGTVEFSTLSEHQSVANVTADANVTTDDSPKEIETVQAYKCVECGEISEEAGDQLYECSNCGTRFTADDSADGMSHRCPDCNRFSSRVADQSCVECQEGEVEEITAYKCSTCEGFYEDEDEARSCCEGEFVQKKILATLDE